MSRRRPRDAGFVLVNALVLAAALAAAAALLLTRAETGRARLQAGQQAAQLTLALDAFEALAAARLSRGAADSTAWTAPVEAAELAGGAVLSGEISDLQGRFNVNWLADPQDSAAREAFDRLLKQLALPPQAGAAIRSFLQPGGPKNRAAWARLDPPLDPVGGALLSTRQLQGIPGLPPRAYARLLPFIAALPGDARLNVNTAPPQVLAALLPQMPPAALNRLAARRRQQPFPSVPEFLAAAGLEQAEAQAGAQADQDGAGANPEDGPASLLSGDRLTVSSDWFQAEAAVQLGAMSGRRVTVLHRQGPRQQAAVAWRLTTRP
ncbi:type II secretion system minor pseudopilin GspK [Leisingera aquaemixtae]|uniref:type II secretion system minor pseudopilin GspK n=1 Tax=Leisingera aquaemixtae TaxID=1396826 RepID=UPI001C97DB8B|nr:type II secretion system minor pseudopilin GspK [Leisingera aquaemixtae]MBY6069028.1 type II secretion system minor pseudopilin GspK [Leisingera aquaemixtae]